MRSFRLLPALIFAGLILAGCMRSDAPFLTTRDAATPLPDAMVLAGESDGMVKGIRADREGDHYLMGEEGKVSAYRLVPLEGGPAKGETLYIAVESNDRGPQAYYALVGIAGEVLTIHNFDAGEIATEIGAEVEDSTFDALFKTEADLLAVFGAAADRLRAGQAEAKDIVFRIVDMTNPAGKAEGERILAETAKAEAAEKAAEEAETADD